jgi:hemerythrin-like domain-containing protein
MNAIQILIKDHQEIKDFFKQFEEAGERAKKKKATLAQDTIKELRSHSQLEEQFFYPAAQQKGGKEINDLILEGLEEHRIADFMMERLETTTPEDDTFDAKYKALSEAVKHHLKEEEKKLFPMTRKVFDRKELNSLGAQMEALEKKLEG